MWLIDIDGYTHNMDNVVGFGAVPRHESMDDTLWLVEFVSVLGARNAVFTSTEGMCRDVERGIQAALRDGRRMYDVSRGG